MSLTAKIARNTIWQIIGKGGSTFLGLIAVAILTRHLGVEKFGWYTTAVSFMQFIAVLSDFGFTVSTSSLLSNPKFDQKKILNTLFTLRFFTGLIFNGGSTLIIWLFPYTFAIKMAATILSLSFFFVSINQVFWGYYQQKLKMGIPAMAEFLSRIVLVVGLILLMKGNYYFLPMMLMITIAASALTFYLWIKSDGVKFFIEKSYLPKIYAHMWPLTMAIIFNAIYLQGDRVILPLYVNQTEVGLYGAAFRVLDIIVQLIALIVGTLMPLLAYTYNTQEEKLFQKRTQNTFDLMTILFIPMIFGIGALATPIITLVAGNEFTASGLILQCLCLGLLGIFFGLIFGHVILSMSRQKKTLWIYISDAIVSLILFFIFIPMYGLWGAVLVSVLAEIYAGVCLTAVAIRQTKFIPSFFIFFKIVIASAIMASAVYLLPSQHVLISILYGVIIYGGLLLLFQVVPKGMIKEIFYAKNGVD